MSDEILKTLQDPPEFDIESENGLETLEIWDEIDKNGEFDENGGHLGIYDWEDALSR